MIKHLLTLLWNRKRSNALLVVEIFFSFLVLFAVTALLVTLGGNWSRPLGFDHENVWNIEIDRKQTTDDTWTAEMTETAERLLRAVQQLEPAESAAIILTPPFSLGEFNGSWMMNGRDVQMSRNEVTDDLDRVLGLELVEGRWFRETDSALGWEPVIIDQELARVVFGSKSPVGQRFGESKEEDLRVVGVVSDFRKGGELSTPDNYLFRRTRLGDPRSRPPQNIVVRLKPGTTAQFETELLATLDSVAPHYSFSVSPLARMRETQLRIRLVPVILAGTIASFLLLMVGLGMIGVLWQNVTQRTREIGLRRALGAPESSVVVQILTEVLLLTAIGVGLATVVIVQIPLLGMGFVSTGTLATAWVLAVAVMGLLAAGAGAYPGKLAARVQPAMALHYE